MACAGMIQFNGLQGPERAKLKTVLDYNSAVGHEQQWTTHKHMFPVPYLQSNLAFKSLNNLVRLQNVSERSGTLPLRSRNSCPRLSSRKGSETTATPAPSSTGAHIYALCSRTHKHMLSVPYLQSYQAFTGLNNLVWLQNGLERSAPLPLQSWNSCPRISNCTGFETTSGASAPSGPGAQSNGFRQFADAQ
jgi:hypothetical protein